MGVVIFNLTAAKSGGEFKSISAICKPRGAVARGFSSSKQAWITRYERYLGLRPWVNGGDNGIWLSRQQAELKLKKLLQERDGAELSDRKSKLSNRAKKAWKTRRENATI